METETYKKRLAEEQATLEAQLAEIGQKNPSNPNDWEAKPQETGVVADENERADQMEEYSENNAILTDLEIRLSEVKAALSRIDAGTYGVCEVSGEQIEADRLDADPAAKTCIAHIS